MQYVSIYIYAYKYIYRVNLIISPAWICPWSTVIQNAFLFTISFYLELFRQTHDSHDECCQPKKTCFFIGVCSVKVFYTVSAKKTPTGVGKAGKPFQVQSSSLKGLFVRFKKLIVRDPWKQQWLYISLVSLVVNFPGKIIPPKWGFQW